MAQLTLSDKAEMASNGVFQERMRVALKQVATFFRNATPAALADYNRRMQLRKQYAERILNGTYPDMQAVCGFFLQLYQEDPPLLDANDQLTDAVLVTGTWLDPTFDFFAGVQPGDENEPIEWGV